ncbi:hypothetical protein H4R99_001934 [Coemansia sp. RSA 1722]|nr:hypothetical protein LPJ57_002101 [Coemansia sp. RSA 486]KAJ2237457.1 hypothetical protein IWW45_000907 [Coemansia sp. RSA 485]KAJ2604229.1 hypothetical protein H4R99_001934 [Coemansia sp. RSA 1722]
MFFKVSAIAALVASASAHMAITSPCPRYSANGENCPALPAGAAYDYSIRSPLAVDQALCKYTTPYDTPSATWTAGQAVTVDFEQGGAAHGGGHCQFSLSYDGGKTFVVVHEELKYCFFGSASDGNTATISSYTFNLPADVPSSDKAVFAWSWVNAIGNREFYMNCADVAIKGTSKSFTGKEMTIANHNGYPTIPEFNGNYDTGLEYYTGAKQITVTGSGSTSSGGSGSGSGSASTTTSKTYSSTTTSGAPIGHGAQTSSATATATVPAPVYTTTTAAAPQTTSAAPQTTSAAPQTTSAAPSTSCTHGVMQCNGTGYKVCVWGKWSALINCGARTACKQTSSSAVICDWA